jgi:tryptophanyl-tRNA synthetase
MARVFSGVQPSGDLQLGNYIGALRYFVADQDVHECLFCVVDLHAITVPQDPAELRKRTYDVAALYLAVGLDPEKATLFVQSHVPQHAELAWVLGCFGMFGELRRMTQFKDKSAKQQEGSVSLGLFAYPALMAADILLYDAERVPVGDDQRQHLELARDIAQRFNSRYGDTFVVPQAAIAKQGARVMDLQFPENKMSKSADSPQGTLGLLDAPEVVRKKIKTAVTDSGREVIAAPDKPAITNLLTIFAAVTGRKVSEIEGQFRGKGYGDFKGELADAVVSFLEPIQKRYNDYTSDLGELSRVLDAGAQRAEAIAAPKLRAVYDKVGFVPRVR